MALTPQARLNRQAYPGESWRRYRVTPHFRMGEFANDQVAAPTHATMLACRQLALGTLEPLRKRFGACTIISGHRSPAHNAQVGGAARSWHVWEWHPGEIGVDVVFRRGTPAQWADAAAHTEAGGIGRYSGHLHVDSRQARTVWRSDAP
jgi:uncharacterized protein YcbK (DUF882 family)